MKYTDGMFALPIRVYDVASLKRIRKMEEDLDIHEDGEWAEGIAKIPFDNIKGLIDYFSKGTSLEEVEKEGFDCCVVLTQDFGDFMCNRSREWVEDRLDKFAEKYLDKIEKFVEEELAAKEDTTQAPQGSWWSRVFRKSA